MEFVFGSVRKCSDWLGAKTLIHCTVLEPCVRKCSEVFGLSFGSKNDFCTFFYILIYLDFPALFYTDLNCFCYFDAFQAHYERFLPKSQKND